MDNKFNWDIKRLLPEPTMGLMTPFRLSESNSSDTDPPNHSITFCVLKTIICQWPVEFTTEVEDKVMSPKTAHWERLTLKRDYMTDFYNRINRAGWLARKY